MAKVVTFVGSGKPAYQFGDEWQVVWNAQKTTKLPFLAFSLAQISQT